MLRSTTNSTSVSSSSASPWEALASDTIAPLFAGAFACFFGLVGYGNPALATACAGAHCCCQCSQSNLFAAGCLFLLQLPHHLRLRLHVFRPIQPRCRICFSKPLHSLDDQLQPPYPLLLSDTAKPPLTAALATGRRTGKTAKRRQSRPTTAAKLPLPSLLAVQNSIACVISCQKLPTLNRLYFGQILLLSQSYC